MRTVQPAIMIGSYGWDEDRLPRDEFQLRTAELHRLMDANGWQAMLIHGDAREHRALAYYTNFVPRLRWAMALVPRTGEPRLLVSMSARDVPWMKLMTFIADVRTGWDWAGGFESWLATLPPDGPARIGTLGFDEIAATLHGAVERSLGNRFTLHDAQKLLPTERPLRPREISLMSDAAAMVQEAAGAMAAAWRGGAGAEAASLAGERAARAMAAQDVRTLVSLDGGRSLVPFQANFSARPDPFVGYLAVKQAGFWAELFVTAATRPGALHERALAGLAAAHAAFAPGVEGGAVFAASCAALGTTALHPVLGQSVGRRVGLSLDEGGALTRDSRHKIALGSVYALHVGAVEAGGGALASAMVAVGPRGVRVLCRSDDV